MSKLDPFDLRIASAAEHAGLPSDIVRGMVSHESSFDPWAINPEPPYRYYWDVRNGEPFRKITAAERVSEIPPKDFRSMVGVPRDAEWWGQAVSWGLLQIMGATARERGYARTWLTELNNPEIGLHFGCRHMAAQMRRYDGDIRKAIAAYNAGSARYAQPGVFVNQRYVDTVLAAAERYRAP